MTFECELPPGRIRRLRCCTTRTATATWTRTGRRAEEGYGVTNNPKPKLRAATFNESTFDLAAGRRVADDQHAVLLTCEPLRRTDPTVADEPVGPIIIRKRNARTPGAGSSSISFPSSTVGAELQRILRLQVPVIVRLAERKLAMSEVLRLGVGAIIEFAKSSDEPLELLINNKPIGAGRHREGGGELRLEDHPDRRREAGYPHARAVIELRRRAANARRGPARTETQTDEEDREATSIGGHRFAALCDRRQLIR